MSVAFSRRDRSSGLVYLERRPAGGPSGLALVLHGRGASKEDLEDLGLLLVEDGFAVLLPDAPLAWGPGFAWFDPDAAVRDPRASRAAVAGLVRSYRREVGLERERTVVVGFSQGGALALDVALHERDVAARAACLSGYLLVEPEGTLTPPASVFFGHGTEDPLVAIERGRAARDTLVRRGVPVDWNEYPIEHSICEAEVRDLRAWLGRSSSVDAS